jgi:hypothetical protein
VTAELPEDLGDVEVNRACLALLAAVLDGDCQARALALLCREGDPHFAVRVAHQLAHVQVEAIPRGERAQMRAELDEEMRELAGR